MLWIQAGTAEGTLEWKSKGEWVVHICCLDPFPACSWRDAGHSSGQVVSPADLMRIFNPT